MKKLSIFVLGFALGTANAYAAEMAAWWYDATAKTPDKVCVLVKKKGIMAISKLAVETEDWSTHTMAVTLRRPDADGLSVYVLSDSRAACLVAAKAVNEAVKLKLAEDALSQDIIKDHQARGKIIRGEADAWD